MPVPHLNVNTCIPTHPKTIRCHSELTKGARKNTNGLDFDVNHPQWLQFLLSGRMGLKRVVISRKSWELTILQTSMTTSEICKQCTCKRWWAQKYADYCGTLSQQGNTRSISEAGSVFKGFWLADLWLAYTLLSDTPDRRVNTDHKWTTCSYSSSKCSVAGGLPHSRLFI